MLEAHVEGIGYWSPGLPGWAEACRWLHDAVAVEDAPKRPAPRLLAPNERRRAPSSVAVALEVALAACDMAGRDPATLPSVFTSTHGDLGITDYMSRTLAGPDPASISPTRFHNSVHNAAAGYWTIGAGCLHPATALSALDASFAQGLIEALVQLATGTEAVLLVAYDADAPGPLAEISPSRGLLGGALLLARTGKGPRLRARLEDGEAISAGGALATREAGNAMAPMLPLFEQLAEGHGTCTLKAGSGRVLRVEIA
ncbi:beta-ketoacyl synthase chain length factor [Luteimonas sp. e5]